MNYKTEMLLRLNNIALTPLNEIESVDLLITSTERNITLEELWAEDSDLTLHHVLELEPNLNNWGGIPQYIIILANLLKNNEFFNINIVKEIQEWVRIEMKTRREKDLKRKEFLTRYAKLHFLLKNKLIKTVSLACSLCLSIVIFIISRS